MAKAAGDTPLMQQHKAIKQKYPDAILLFRVGDFYETFGQDAVIASQVLGITLTKRNNGAAASSELAGFPHHALDTYLHKLVKARYRVAICDQLEDPKTVKGLVKRGVTEMVSPGTAVNDKLLDHHSNNFLAALHYNTSNIGIAFLDISTGEFLTAEGDVDYIENLLQSFRPSEVIFQRNYLKKFKEAFGDKWYLYTLDDWVFTTEYTQEILLKQFQTHSLKGFGVDDQPDALIAAGVALHYLKDTEHPNLQHIGAIQRIYRNDFLWMDKFTIRNLELINASGEEGKSLLQVMDSTHSPMGARLLKRWVVFPLKDEMKINERMDVVTYFIKETDLRLQLVQAIKLCGDIERLASKIPLRKIMPREVLQLAKGLKQVAHIKTVCGSAENEYLKRLGDALNPCPYIAEKIITEIVDNPPATAQKGGIIQPNIRPELDELRQIAHHSREYLAAMQQKEIERTGISSLKIGFNNVFGYYLEVTNSQKAKVPPEWMRKQTLANAERYITPELKEYEEKILGAEEKILKLELEVYELLLTEIMDYLAPVHSNGNLVAIMDCLCCFADNAVKYKYKRPEIHTGDEWKVTASRHPVIERHLPAGENYISNDLLLNKDAQQVIILTGPNMSGKSALLRQTALITIMAQMGSYIPADSGYLSLVDKIFTRVGASDNLSGGESTFMVEMNETASIINNFSKNSLILLDEIGRGTSTYDGISLAWSIVEYLHNNNHKPKTLFATHYHELNELEERLAGVKNYHITHKEQGNKIIFLRKLAPGGSTHSFGIHVARMAGMPQLLIDRAAEILHQLEDERSKTGELTGQAATGSNLQKKVKQVSLPQMQLSIFDEHSQVFDEIRNILENTDINRLTPVEALLKLQEIKNKLQ